MRDSLGSAMTRTLDLLLLLVATILASGCQDPAAAGSLTGAWRVSEVWGADSVDCSVVTETLTVARAGVWLTGKMSPGSGLCIAYGFPYTNQTLGGTITGNAAGSRITFQVNSGLSYQGAIAPTSLSGTLDGQVSVGAPARVIHISGSWSATKQ